MAGRQAGRDVQKDAKIYLRRRQGGRERPQRAPGGGGVGDEAWIEHPWGEVQSLPEISHRVISERLASLSQ